jgi:hypothetical protein
MEETTTEKLINHIEQWNKDRITDLQAIMSNPAGEWECGIMLSNGHSKDMTQVIAWMHQLAVKIKELEDKITPK